MAVFQTLITKTFCRLYVAHGPFLMIIFSSMSKKLWHLDSIYCKAMLGPGFGQSLRQTDRVITILLELQISGGCFYINQFNQFLRNLHTVLCSGLYQVTFPPTAQECSLSSTPSPAFMVCRFFVDSHFDQCEVIPHGNFDLHFSNN